MKQLLDTLGVADGKRLYKNADIGKDLTYGTPKYEIGKETEVLFPALTSHF